MKKFYYEVNNTELLPEEFFVFFPDYSGSLNTLFVFLNQFSERERERERDIKGEGEALVCIFTYLCIHWLFLVCALTKD